jgi:hypothetical protein
LNNFFLPARNIATRNGAHALEYFNFWEQTSDYTLQQIDTILTAPRQRMHNRP